jgi:hypothetical protein
VFFSLSCNTGSGEEKNNEEEYGRGYEESHREKSVGRNLVVSKSGTIISNPRADESGLWGEPSRVFRPLARRP